MKRIKLRLTGVASVVTEAAEKKLEQGDSYQIPVCSNGKNAEFYDDIGIPLPPDLVEKLKKQEKGIELKEEDFEEEYSDVSLYEDDIVFMVSDIESTTIFVKGGYTLQVIETVDEIDAFVDYMSRNGLEKIRDYFLFLFRRKNKIQEIVVE